MLDRIMAFLGDGGDPAHGTGDGTDDIAVAASALLVEAAVLDGQFDARERETIRQVLADHFDLGDAAAAALVEKGQEALADSHQLYEFTRKLKDEYSHEERVGILEMLWQVAYADGELHDFEANLVRRIAGLLYVADRDSGAARKRVMAKMGL